MPPNSNTCLDEQCSLGEGLTGSKLFDSVILGINLASPSGNHSDNHSSESTHRTTPSFATKKMDKITIQYTDKEKRERKYVCQYCQKRFSRPSSLTSHIYTHTGERPFACDFLGCTKRFSVLSNLRRHFKVHASRRTYGDSRLVSMSKFHGSVYPSVTSGRSYSFGAELASPVGLAFNRSAQAQVSANQGHPAMSPAYSMPAPSGRELFSSSIALQHGSGVATIPTGLSNYNSSSYAPSFRTTAPILSLPEPFSAPLFAGFADEHLLTPSPPLLLSPPKCLAPLSASASSSSSGSSNSSSPTSKQPLCLADPVPNNDNAHNSVQIDGEFAATDQPNPAITASQFETIFGRLPVKDQFGNSNTCGASGSDSDNSSDHAHQTSLSLLPLGKQDFADAANPGSFDTLDMLIKAESSTALSDIFPGGPRIATQAMLTNTSVTTKAMNGAIESAGQDLSLLFSPISTKSTPLALVGLPPPHNRQLLHNGNASSAGVNMLGSIGGMATSLDLAALGTGEGGTGNPLWRLL
ncbi:hypothetical protein GGI20_001478 [Coemansia sp. BCRC 34301]|nr:hypothetical protein GGI20_001478 [Coemansia sp. BCRC 34301]